MSDEVKITTDGKHVTELDAVDATPSSADFDPFIGPADPIRGRLATRPTGATVLLASSAVIIAHRLGVELTIEEAVTLIASAGLIVSWLSPRH